MKNTLVKVLVVVAIGYFAVTGLGGGMNSVPDVFGSIGYTSEEPCEWCGDTPTKQVESEQRDYIEEYYGSDYEAYYYCEDCVTHCFYCYDDADFHYTNGFELEVFTCDECYDEEFYDYY